jgi:hypothetical protein
MDRSMNKTNLFSRTLKKNFTIHEEWEFFELVVLAVKLNVPSVQVT